MKLSKIAQICKKHMDITVFRANGAQWFCVGPAAYAAYGLPELTTSEQVLTLLDVPAEQQEEFTVHFTEIETQEHFFDTEEGEQPLRDVDYTFMQRGRYLSPLYDDSGAVWWLNERYLAPLGAEEITYWLRPSAIGYDIAVKKGYAIQAVIGIHLATSEVEESLHEMMTGSAIGWRKGYRVPKETVEKMNGLQMMVCIGTEPQTDKPEEEYEQEELA